jgi:adenylylsulfate kinase-like enzyme
MLYLRILNFIGISDPTEAPDSYELNINTGEQTLDQSTVLALTSLTLKAFLGKDKEPSLPTKS